jgi:hypothetical protein
MWIVHMLAFKLRDVKEIEISLASYLNGLSSFYHLVCEVVSWCGIKSF